MIITVSYGWKTFGNGMGPQKYRVSFERSGQGLTMAIVFDQPVKGKGGFTENKARVRSARLDMRQQHARAIAEAILEALDGEDATLTLNFDDE